MPQKWKAQADPRCYPTPDPDEQVLRKFASVGADPEEVRTYFGNNFDAQCASDPAEGDMPRLAQTADRAAEEASRAQDEIDECVDEFYPVRGGAEDRLHIFDVTAGALALLLMGTLVVGMPIVVTAGIHQSYAIDLVEDYPELALFYALPPLAVIAGLSALRDTLSTQVRRQQWDRIVFLAASVVFVGWAVLYGPTFLADPGGYGSAAVESSNGLLSFYGWHLALEICGATGLHRIAEKHLTANAKRVRKANPERDMLCERRNAALKKEQEARREYERLRDGQARRRAAREAYVSQQLALFDALSDELQGRRAEAQAKAGRLFVVASSEQPAAPHPLKRPTAA